MHPHKLITRLNLYDIHVKFNHVSDKKQSVNNNIVSKPIEFMILYYLFMGEAAYIEMCLKGYSKA